jgi:hypothetical protein
MSAKKDTFHHRIKANFAQLLWNIFKRDEIVFYAWYPIHYVMFQNIHRLLPQVKIVVPLQNRAIRSYLKSIGVPYRVWRGYPKIVITAHRLKRSQYGQRGIKRITIFHGMAKDIMFHNYNRNFDLLLVMGDYAKERFKELGMDNVRVVGYPKIDGLFNNSIDIHDYAKRLGLDPNKKTLLYAPTWGPLSSFPLISEKMEELSNQFNIMVKLHDKSVKDWSGQLQNGKLIPINDPNIVPYYLLSDILISDYSSVIFEYSVLDRPIILFDTDTEHYNQQSIGYQWRDIGLRVNDFGGLVEAIDRSLENPLEFHDQRQNYAKRIFKYLDGNSAQRAAKAIQEFAAAEGIDGLGL